MAYHYHDITFIGENCLHGANLLTLCLLKPARPDVLQHVINLAAKEAPKHLNLPDAVGRTPLWVAIDSQDQASIQLLLKAGADPLQACKFSEIGEPKSPLSVVAKSADKELFRDLLRAIVEQGKKFTPYNFNKDPMHLKRWASSHSSEDVLWLADQVKELGGSLLCCEDASGSSFLYRAETDGVLDEVSAISPEDLNNFVSSTVDTIWMKSSTLSFDEHARLLKNVWPFIDENTKNYLFFLATTRSHDFTELVIGMFDCNLNYITANNIFKNSHVIKNSRAFEFAADRSVQMAEVLESLSAGNVVDYEWFLFAINAGSLKWVEKLIAAGLRLEDMFAISTGFINKLADLDPQGLAEKLNDLQIQITPEMVDDAKTEAGKQALMALMANPNNAN